MISKLLNKNSSSPDFAKQSLRRSIGSLDSPRIHCANSGNDAIRGMFVFLSSALCLFFSNPAHAVCASPAGVAGEIIYNSANKVMQYCNDTAWIAMGEQGTGVGGCTGPVDVDGAMIFNSDKKVLQYCAGSVWVPVGQKPDITTGLIGHWKLDESAGTSAADSSGGANTGTLTNGPVWQPTTGGISNGALSFDGVDDYVDIANESNFDFDRTDPFSISAWVYDNKTSGFSYVVTKVLNGTNWPGYRFMLDSTNRKLYGLLVGVTGGTAGGDAIDVRTYAGTLSVNAWHHIAMTYDGSATAAGVRLYIDGADMAHDVTHDGLVSSMLNNQTVHLGKSPSDGGGRLDGYLDDVRVYNRVLSGDDVRALYYGGVNLANGLMGHWKLDEASGTTAADSSGNGHNGTVWGGATWEPTAGIVSGDMYFDIVDDCVVMPYTADLELSSGEEITLAGWFKAASVAGATHYIIQSDNSPSSNYQLYVTSGGNAMFEYGETITHRYITSSPPFVANTWMHIASTYQAGVGSSAKLYINGVKVPGYWWQGNGNVAPVTNSRPVSIGCSNNAGTPQYIGAVARHLDDIRIYNRILTGGEIAALASEAPGTCSQSSAGRIIYNSTNSILQYCNGSQWIAAGKGGSHCTTSPFSFTDLTNQALTTLVYSDIIQVTSSDPCEKTISVGANCQAYRICNNATCSSEYQTWGQVTGTFPSGKYVQLMIYTSGTAATTRDCVLQISSQNDTWSVTTAP